MSQKKDELADHCRRFFAVRLVVKGVVDCLRVEVLKHASNQIHCVKANIERSARMHVMNLQAVNFYPLP